MSEERPQSASSGSPPAAAPASGQPLAAPEERTMGMLCHLLAIFTGFIGPLIIWLIKKEESPFVADQGKESLNFQITFLIAYIACIVLMFVVIGIILLPIVVIADIVLVIIATIKANKGEWYRYPFAIRLIK